MSTPTPSVDDAILRTEHLILDDDGRVHLRLATIEDGEEVDSELHPLGHASGPLARRIERLTSLDLSDEIEAVCLAWNRSLVDALPFYATLPPWFEDQLA